MKWTSSDNLHSRWVPIVGGPYAGLRTIISNTNGMLRRPDVFDLSDYTFDHDRQEFTHKDVGPCAPRD